MRKNPTRHLLFICISIMVIWFFHLVPVVSFMQIEPSMVLTKNEFQQLTNEYNNFFVTSEAYQVKALNEEDDKKIQQYQVKFKLFNLINIKNLKVKIPGDDTVLAGGNCVGIGLKSKGVVIVGSNYIITKEGNVSPFKDSNLQVGDVILQMNEQTVNKMDDISEVLKVYKGDGGIVVIATRKNERFETTIHPAFDMQTKTYKLGLWIRDDAVGVGTLTFVNPSNDDRFGSLGHAIMDSDTKVKFEVSGGEVYKCNVVGVKKGQRGKPGELMGLFLSGEKNQLGTVDKNSEHGVYGNIQNQAFLQSLKEYEVGGRLTAKPGKAKILTCLNGTEVKEYSIEIIKTNYQSKPNEKSMVIKVTDPALLNTAGGIVQGMSGSPIIQGGKIIGAVTHVFVNDPTKGFGLYLDWMLGE